MVKKTFRLVRRPKIQGEDYAAVSEVQKVFEALSSVVRRKIMAYLAHGELTAGEIMSRFAMSKPTISQHLGVLSGAGLVVSEKRGQYVYYRLAEENFVTTMTGFMQEVCPVSRPLKRESKRLAEAKRGKSDQT